MELRVQLLKSRLRKRLRENICQLIAIRDEGHVQAFSGDLLANKMEINFDVFDVSIKYKIGCEISGY